MAVQMPSLRTTCFNTTLKYKMEKILCCAGLRHDFGCASAKNDNASILHVILSEAKNPLLFI